LLFLLYLPVSIFALFYEHVHGRFSFAAAVFADCLGACFATNKPKDTTPKKRYSFGNRDRSDLFHTSDCECLNHCTFYDTWAKPLLEERNYHFQPFSRQLWSHLCWRQILREPPNR